MYYYIIGAIVLVGLLAWSLRRRQGPSETFYSTVAPPKYFPEVIGLPLFDAKAWLSRHEDTYNIRTISTYDESYRQDLSTIYVVVDSDNIVTHVL